MKNFIFDPKRHTPSPRKPLHTSAKEEIGFEMGKNNLKNPGRSGNTIDKRVGGISKKKGPNTSTIVKTNLKKMAPYDDLSNSSKKGLDAYEFVNLTLEKDAEEVIEAFSDIFLRREPTIQGLGASPEELIDGYTPVVKQCLQSEMSLGAKHKSTGKLVSFMLNKILTPKDKNAFDGHVAVAKSKKMANLEDMLKKVENAVNIFEKYNVEKVLELALAFTHPDHARKGLAKELYKQSLDLGFNNGCQLANALATNVITQAGGKEGGYEIYHIHDLSDNISIDLNKCEGLKAWYMMAKKL